MAHSDLDHCPNKGYYKFDPKRFTQAFETSVTGTNAAIYIVSL